LADAVPTLKRAHATSKPSHSLSNKPSQSLSSAKKARLSKPPGKVIKAEVEPEPLPLPKEELLAAESSSSLHQVFPRFIIVTLRRGIQEVHGTFRTWRQCTKNAGKM
jgi:hypothetical protein